MLITNGHDNKDREKPVIVVIPETGKEATAFYTYHRHKEDFYKKHKGDEIPVELWKIKEEGQPFEYAPILIYTKRSSKEKVRKNATSLVKYFTGNTEYLEDENRIYQDPLKFVGLEKKTF